jgi:hypothetical protein
MKAMEHPSGPVDYTSLTLCAISYLGYIFAKIDSDWVYNALLWGITISGFLYNVTRLVDWVSKKFFNKGDKPIKDNP